MTEKGSREHQCQAGSGDEVWQVLPGLQADTEDSASGQSQACHHRQQHPSPQVGAFMTSCSGLLFCNTVLLYFK